MDFDAENEMPTDSMAPFATQQVLRKDADDAITISSKFFRYYYEILEKKPHLAGQLYLESSVLLWDGNPVVTRDEIQKFIEKLPCLTFKIASMDCQSINNAAVGARTSFIIKTSGQVMISGGGTSSTKAFTQQMILTADHDKWRIATDCFRSQV